jgi:vacuolar-type H+-ATPase subunit B/Vma2
MGSRPRYPPSALARKVGVPTMTLSATRSELIARRLQIGLASNEGGRRWTIEETRDFAWLLLRGLRAGDLKRLAPELVARYGQASDQGPTEPSTTTP